MSHEDDVKAHADEQRKRQEELIEQQVELARAQDKLEEEMKSTVEIEAKKDDTSNDVSLGWAIMWDSKAA